MAQYFAITAIYTNFKAFNVTAQPKLLTYLFFRVNHDNRLLISCMAR